MTPSKPMQTGERYGRLEVVEYLYTDDHPRRFFRCVCDCGGEVVTHAGALRSGNTKSCGCLAKEVRAMPKGGMSAEERRLREIERKRRARRRARGLPDDAVLVSAAISPEEKKRRAREYARKKYRRLRGLTEDAVLRPSPEEVAEKRRATKRANDRKRRGGGSREEYLAKLAAKRAEKEKAKQATILAKTRERLIREARRAEERAMKCQTSTKSGNGTKRNSASRSPAVTVRKPGRIVALCGWSGW